MELRHRPHAPTESHEPRSPSHHDDARRDGSDSAEAWSESPTFDDQAVVIKALAHDLRSPLSAITGFAHVIRRKHRDHLDADARRCFDNLSDAAERLQRMVVDLSTFLQLGTRVRPGQAIELSALIPPIVRGLESRRRHPEDRVRVAEDLPSVWGDATLIRLVLTNVLDNALLYRRPGAAVDVDVRAWREGERVLIEVRDDGVGIPAAYSGTVLDAFRRLRSHAEYPGVGMGLTLANRAVLLSHGALSLDANEPCGTRVRVTLPGGAPADASGRS